MNLSHRLAQTAFRIGLAASLGLVAASASAGHAHRPASSPAQTQPAAAVNMEVIVLHGTNDGSGIDPKIGKIPELSKPPFSSYNSYKQLDRPKISVTKGKQTTIKLPNGRDLAITLDTIIQPTKKDDPVKYVVSTSIQKPGGNTFLPLLQVTAKAGEWFFVAGQTYKGGTLVIGIKVLP